MISLRDDNKTLAECGVVAGSDLHLVLSLRGGGFAWMLNSKLTLQEHIYNDGVR